MADLETKLVLSLEDQQFLQNLRQSDQANVTFKKNIDETNKSSQAAAGSMAELSKRLNEAKRELDNAERGSIQYQRSLQQVKSLTSEYEIAQAQLNKELVAGTGVSNSANFALLSVDQTMSDLPYGIRGVGNNLQQLASQFAFLTRAEGGVKEASLAMFAALKGPLGIVLVFDSLISVMTYFDMHSKSADNSIQELTLDMITSKTAAEKYAESISKITEQLKKMSDTELKTKLDEVNRKIKEINDQVKGFIESQLKYGSGSLGSIYDIFFSPSNDKLKQLAEELKGAKDIRDVINKLLSGRDQKGKINELQIELKNLETKRDEAKTEEEIYQKNLEIKKVKEEINRLENLGIEKKKQKIEQPNFNMPSAYDVISPDEIKSLNKEITDNLNEDLQTRLDVLQHSTSSFFLNEDGINIDNKDLTKEMQANAVDSANQKMNKSLQSIRSEARIVQATFTELGNSIVDAMVRGKTSVGDLITSIASLILKMTIANIVSGFVGGLFPALDVAGGSASVPIFHGGGFSDFPTRKVTVDPSIFAGARRFASGGIPAILDPHEMILNTGQQMKLFNYLSTGMDVRQNNKPTPPKTILVGLKKSGKDFVLDLEEVQNYVDRSFSRGQL